MFIQIIIITILLLSSSVNIHSQHEIRGYNTFTGGMPTNLPSSETCPVSKVPKLKLSAEGDQDDFDDPGGTDNPGGTNDPAPVGSGWIGMFLLGISYLIWKIKKAKTGNDEIFNSISVL